MASASSQQNLPYASQINEMLIRHLYEARDEELFSFKQDGVPSHSASRHYVTSLPTS